MVHMRGWTGLLPVLSVIACACASAPVPAERLASAEAATRGATEVGAQTAPQAALHLKLARDQITQAKGLIEAGDNARAERVLMRAEADAELALAIAREGTARAEANALLAQAHAMRQRSP